MNNPAKDIVKARQNEARARAGRIRAGIASYLHTLADVAAAYRDRDWITLGYQSWEWYIEGEYSAERLRLSPEHRQKAVEELRLAGLSQRAIGSALGVSQETVRRDLSGDTNVSPESVLGADGKSYSTSRPSPLEPGTAGEAANRGAPVASHQDHPRLPAGEAHAGLADHGWDDGTSAEADGGPTPDAGDEAGAGPRSAPASQDQEFMSRFVASLAKSGGWMQFDAERVAELASPTTWAAIEAHAEVVAHTYERMRKARRTLRVLPGGAA